jgi:hypothetical protein
VVIVKARAVLEAGLLLILVFSGVLSVYMLSEPARLGFCDGGVIVVPDDFQKIGWAVGNASGGNTILVRSGYFFESQVIVDKTVTLIGEKAENTIIDGGGTLQSIFLVIANNVVIENLTLQNTYSAAYPPTPAVSLSNVTNVTLVNVFCRNVGCGVEIRSSNFTRVSHGRISNSTYGVLIRGNSYDNVVAGNSLENNSLAVSISSTTCSYNRIFHNNFLNNTNQFSDFGSFNSYDDGYPSGGNFWGDYTEQDLFSGQYQNETGSDGILDMGYPSGNPLDRYPFGSPLTEIGVTAGGSSFFLQISTDVNVTGYFLNDTAKSINLMVQPHTSGNDSCRITIPKILLSTNDTSEWRVSETYLNGTASDRPYWAMNDSENSYIYLTHIQSDIAQIEIRGTNVLSEVSIPLMAIGVILVSASLLFAKRLTRRRKKQSYARASK